MRGFGRWVFGVCSFLPAAGVIALATMLSRVVVRPGDPFRALARVPSSTWIWLGGGVLAVAAIQIALGVVVAVDASKRPQLGGAEKAAWTVGALLFGSVVAPIYFFARVLKPAPPPVLAPRWG